LSARYAIDPDPEGQPIKKRLGIKRQSWLIVVQRVQCCPISMNGINGMSEHEEDKLRVLGCMLPDTIPQHLT
jgi:hypothetical protein